MNKVIKLNPLINYSSTKELLNFLLSLNIEVLEELLEDDSLKEWDILLENFGCSREALKESINKRVILYKNIINGSFSKISSIEVMKLLSSNWRRLLMETLYIIEEDLYAQGKSRVVVKLWEEYFSVENGELLFEPQRNLDSLIKNNYIKNY